MCDQKNEAGKKTNGTEGNVDLENIFERVGLFGLYQIRVVTTLALVAVFTSWSVYEHIFSTASIPTRCYILECDSESPEYITPWILNAIPGTSNESFEQCERYASLNTSHEYSVCPSEAFNQNLTQRCDEFVYQNSDTVVYDFGLACDEWKRSFIGSAKFTGFLISLPFVGYASDRWGRKMALAVGAYSSAFVGITKYWVGTYWLYVFINFCETLLGPSKISCPYIIITELLPAKYRISGGAFLLSAVSIGQASLGAMAWMFPQWRTFTLAIYIPQIIMITLILTIDESCRWLISKEKYEKSVKVIKTIARDNKREISDKVLERLKFCCEAEKKRKTDELKKNESKPGLILQLLKYKKVLVISILAPLWFITATVVYYGLSFNVVNMSGNKYLNYMLVSLVDIPGFWFAVYFVNKIGRKPVLISGYWCCCACMAGYIFVSSGSPVALALYFVSKFCIAAVLNSVYLYTAELYPTEYRNTLFGITSMLGRCGPILAPFTKALSDALFPDFPYVVFAALCLLCGGLIFLTPETLGTKLPDTMEEASALGQEKI